MAIASEVPAASRQAGHPVWMEVDLGRLAHNLGMVRRLASPSTRIIASVKANAYGLGVVDIARALESLGCDALATGSLSEALEVRKAGNRLPILMFGRCLPEAYREMIAHDLIPTVHASGQAEALNRAAGGKPVAAYVKVDAGLGRLGIPMAGAEQQIVAMASLPGIALRGLYTHLPFARADQAHAIQQRLDRFADLVRRLTARGIDFDVVQASASSALLSDLADPFNAVCPGHALYGLEPTERPLGRLKGLHSVLRAVRTRLIQVGAPQRPAGADAGGYGGSPGATRRGVVPVGQAEGLSANGVANGQFALLGGRPVPVVSVSFEHTVLDLSSCHDCAPGDVVTLLGEDGDEKITLEQFATWRGAPVKEALMALSGRLAVIYS